MQKFYLKKLAVQSYTDDIFQTAVASKMGTMYVDTLSIQSDGITCHTWKYSTPYALLPPRRDSASNQQAEENLPLCESRIRDHSVTFHSARFSLNFKRTRKGGCALVTMSSCIGQLNSTGRKEHRHLICLSSGCKSGGNTILSTLYCSNKINSRLCTQNKLSRTNDVMIYNINNIGISPFCIPRK